MHRALTPAQLAVLIAKSSPCRPHGFAIMGAVADSPGAMRSGTFRTKLRLPRRACEPLCTASLDVCGIPSAIASQSASVLLCRPGQSGSAHQEGQAVNAI